MAQVRRPVPFRTRKLRPGTAMVLHPTGCGRVARRRTTRTGSPSEHTPQGAFPISGHPRVGVFLASLGLSVSDLLRSAARTAPPQRGEPETSWAPTGYSCRGPVRFGRQPAEYPVRWLRYQHTGQEVTRMVAPSRDDRSVDALVKSKAVLDVLAELGPSTAKTISERTGEPVSSTYRRPNRKQTGHSADRSPYLPRPSWPVRHLGSVRSEAIAHGVYRDTHP